MEENMQMENLVKRSLRDLSDAQKTAETNKAAAKLAEEIGCNARYISAVLHLRYRDNFSQLINDFRIKEAMYMITDRHFSHMNMEEVAMATGFSNRQCFYAAFFRKTGTTPTDYRQQNATKNKKKASSETIDEE